MAKLEGLDELLATLDGLGGDVKKSLRIGIGRAAERIKGQAKEHAPVRRPVKVVARTKKGKIRRHRDGTKIYEDKDKSEGGYLRNSIHSYTKIENDIVKGRVYTNCEYAKYVNYGTGQRGAKHDAEGNSIHHRADWKGQAPQPFMDSAYLYGKNNNILEKELTKVIKQEINKWGGKK